MSYRLASFRSSATPPDEPGVVGLSLQVVGHRPDGAERFLFTLAEADRVVSFLIDAIAIQRSRMGDQPDTSSGSPSVDVSTVVGQ
jgi:hypothetical protein